MASQSQGHHHLVMLKKVDAVPEEPNDPVQGVADLRYEYGIGGHFVIATVEYGGGHADHEFEACWDGSWMKSMPPGVRIFLRHNANGDPGKALLKKTLQINIAELVDTGQREFWLTIEAGRCSSEQLDIVVEP